MHIIFLFITLYTLVNGDCNFSTDDSKLLQGKLKEREIYNKM